MCNFKDLFAGHNKIFALVAGVSFVFSTLALSIVCYNSFCHKDAIGYVDLYKVEKSPKIKAIYEENENAMNKLVKDISSRSENAKPEEVEKLRAEFDKKFAEIREKSISEQRKAVQDVVGEIIKEKKLKCVIPSEYVIGGGKDITFEVIDRLK